MAMVSAQRTSMEPDRSKRMNSSTKTSIGSHPVEETYCCRCGPHRLCHRCRSRLVGGAVRPSRDATSIYPVATPSATTINAAKGTYCCTGHTDVGAEHHAETELHADGGESARYVQNREEERHLRPSLRAAF